MPDPDPNEEKAESARMIEKLLKDWESCNEIFTKIENEQSEYVDKLNDIHKRQETCAKNVKSHRQQVFNLKDSLKKINVDELSSDEAMQIQDLAVEIAERKARLDDMREQLPQDNNGFRYKDEYEKFKMTVTMVCMSMAALAFFLHFRVIDALFHFLLVWYYCTLTIRESILRCNGSRIKGWWVAHHYLSAILCGVLLTWPDGVCYVSFRKQFIVFSLYLTFVQLIQCQYQRGCLYRLRALGKRHSMDITIEGFHSWMFRGLTFVLPFLFIGYFFQMYNAYTLLTIWWQESCTSQWQVFALAILFLILAVGNILTTGQVCWIKFHETGEIAHRQRLKTKYQDSDTQEVKIKAQ